MDNDYFTAICRGVDSYVVRNNDMYYIVTETMLSTTTSDILTGEREYRNQNSYIFIVAEGKNMIENPESLVILSVFDVYEQVKKLEYNYIYDVDISSENFDTILKLIQREDNLNLILK